MHFLSFLSFLLMHIIMLMILISMHVLALETKSEMNQRSNCIFYLRKYFVSSVHVVFLSSHFQLLFGI